MTDYDSTMLFWWSTEMYLTDLDEMICIIATYTAFVTNNNRALWDSATPFGNPVVPLEQRITAAWLLSPIISVASYADGSTAFSLFKILDNVIWMLFDDDSLSKCINSIRQDRSGWILAMMLSVRRETKMIRGFEMFNTCWNSSKDSAYLI